MNRNRRKNFSKFYKKLIFIVSLLLFMCVGYSSLVQELNFSVGAKFDAPAVLDATTSNDTATFRNATYKEKIKSITFEDKINIPSEAVASWDIGVNNNGDVMAFVVTNEIDSAYYDLYIQSNSQLYANKDMSFWFSGLTAVDTINGLELLDTSMTTNMGYMFYGTLLKDETTNWIKYWDLSKLTNIYAMFGHTYARYCVINMTLPKAVSGQLIFYSSHTPPTNPVKYINYWVAEGEPNEMIRVNREHPELPPGIDNWYDVPM